MTKEENEKRLERLKAIVSNLPNKPGSYQYYDESGTMRAAYDLVKKFNPKKIYVNFIIELTREGLNATRWSIRKKTPCCSRTV